MLPAPARPPPLPAGAFGDRAALRAAVHEWVANSSAAEATHGSISGWDTSRVDDMSGCWCSPTWDGFFPSGFDAQIGGWDTSKVTNMEKTFANAKAFNHPLDWDTSKVTTMRDTFWSADAFNSELAWDTSKVMNMQYTFSNSKGFNKPLDWDTSQVTNMGYMFYNARAFNQELVWDASSVTTMRRTFDGTALESDDCSKQKIHEAWEDVTAFTNEYDWSANFCSPPSPPLAPPPPSPPLAPPSASPSPPPSASPSPPPSASPSPSPATTSAPESGLGAGEIAGISVGVVLLLLLATAAALRVYQPSVVEKAVALLQRSLTKANAALTSKPADVNVNNV